MWTFAKRLVEFCETTFTQRFLYQRAAIFISCPRKSPRSGRDKRWKSSNFLALQHLSASIGKSSTKHIPIPLLSQKSTRSCRPLPYSRRVVRALSVASLRQKPNRPAKVPRYRKGPPYSGNRTRCPPRQSQVSRGAAPASGASRR